jgi:hypothetical protein
VEGMTNIRKWWGSSLGIVAGTLVLVATAWGRNGEAPGSDPSSATAEGERTPQCSQGAQSAHSADNKCGGCSALVFPIGQSCGCHGVWSCSGPNSEYCHQSGEYCGGHCCEPGALDDP